MSYISAMVHPQGLGSADSKRDRAEDVFPSQGEQEIYHIMKNTHGCYCYS